MTKISVYQIDEYVTADDKWIGTDVNTYNKTKNFTPRKLAVYFNGSQVINTGVDLLYKYFTITPPEDRPIGTLSFETEIGPTVNFSAISTFLLSKTTQKGNDVSEFLNFLVNSTSLIYKAKNVNLFGSYKIVSVEPYFLDPNFFVVNVDFLEGNGFIEEDEDYMISIVDLDRTVEVPQLVKETFEYTSSNSFVVANEINNILQVIVNTTSLHPEAYSYTLPSTITIINELEAGDVITVVYNYIEEFLDVPDLQRVTNIGNHTTNSIVIDNTPGEWGDYTTINTISDLGTFQSLTSPTNIDYQSEYSGYGVYINEIYSATDSREMFIESGTIQTSYTDVDDYNEIKMYSGSSTEGPVLSMERNYVTCQLKINDMTESIILQIPNKPEGTYTIATTADVAPFTPSDYDLDEFTNNGIDPFAHVSDIANKENSANKQNSLAVDGTGTKFPTVDAVNDLVSSLVEKYTTQTGLAYTLQLSDANSKISFSNGTQALAVVTMPTDAIVPFPIGTIIRFQRTLSNYGVSVSGSGVAFTGLASPTTYNGGQINLTIVKIATNTWESILENPVTLNSGGFTFPSGQFGVIAGSTVYGTFFGQFNQMRMAVGATLDFGYAFGTMVDLGGTVMNMTQNFSPTSITSPFTGFNLSPTINQTGGANGITRGLYINPTLTSAADFRAIEVTAGKVIVPDGVASNEAVNKGQLDAALPTFLEFNATDKTVWNNGQGNVAANTSFGASALKTNTTGTDNSAFGVGALRNNTSGSYNTAIGLSLVSNTVGSNNISIGYISQAEATIASSNVSIGNGSLYWNIDGNGNTAIGDGSGVYETSNPLTKINNSVFIGKNTRAFAVNDTNEIVIGADATGSGSNTATLGNDSITSTILKGLVKAPLTTNALIDADATGKALVTKEYLTTANYWTKTGNNIYNNITGGVTYFGENTSSAYYDKDSKSILGAWVNGSFTNSSIGIRQSGGSTDGIAMYLNSLEAYLTAGTNRNLNLNTLNPTGTINFKINNANKLILNNNGTLNYSADYSSLYVDRSLVDKGYVNNRLVLEKSGNYTLVDADSGGIIIFTASATLTIPTGLAAGFECTFVTLAGVTLTVSATGVTLNNNTSTTLLPQLSFTLKRMLTSNIYIVTGDL